MCSMSRRAFVKAAGVTIASLAVPPLACAGDAGKHPNILFILADDMGLIDTTLFGSRYYETPNIERLASRGMLFTNAYSASPDGQIPRASEDNHTGLPPASTGSENPPDDGQSRRRQENDYASIASFSTD